MNYVLVDLSLNRQRSCVMYPAGAKGGRFVDTGQIRLWSSSNNSRSQDSCTEAK